MLSKIAWFLSTNKTSIVAKIFQTKYGSMIESVERIQTRKSSIWKDLEICKSILNGFVIKRISNGNNIKVWLDPWVPNNQKSRVKPKNGATQINNSMLVKDLINPQTRSYNISVLNNLFNKETISNILKIYIPKVDEEDKIVWKLNNNGNTPLNLSI